jgi:hypothetical protein
MIGHKLIKNTNDFLIGIVLLVLGIYILFTNDIMHGNVMDSGGGPLVRPDVYVRLIGGGIAICAAILVIKSINFSGTAVTEGFHFVLSLEVALTIVGLVVYTVLFDIIGFGVSTFLLIFFLTCIYTRKEKSGEGKPPLTRKEIVKDLIIALVYSALLDLIVYLLFSQVLHVALP